jgi:regulator of sigma E protease
MGRLTVGLARYKPKVPAIIGEILSNSAADKVGFMPNDKILKVGGAEITDWEQVVNIIKDSPNKELQFEIERAQKTLSITAIPETIDDNGKAIGRMGAAVKMDKKLLGNFLINIRYSPLIALQKAVNKTWHTSVFSLKMLGKIVTGKASIKGISGPITIADYAGKSANMGLAQFLEFLALVSISIGILNLLPIPVLDGGHLMYYIVEIFKGSPVSEQSMLVGQKIGFGLLGLLMTIAIFNDFNRLIVGY